MANRLLTRSEVCKNMWESALNVVGGDERAAKTLLCLMHPMIQRPPKAERDHLTSVAAKLGKDKV